LGASDAGASVAGITSSGVVVPPPTPEPAPAVDVEPPVFNPPALSSDSLFEQPAASTTPANMASNPQPRSDFISTHPLDLLENANPTSNFSHTLQFATAAKATTEPSKINGWKN
jgi:hypothetical protein